MNYFNQVILKIHLSVIQSFRKYTFEVTLCTFYEFKNVLFKIKTGYLSRDTAKPTTTCVQRRLSSPCITAKSDHTHSYIYLHDENLGSLLCCIYYLLYDLYLVNSRINKDKHLTPNDYT